MTFKSLVSQLQSRISKRANVITSTEQWKKVHRVQEQMKDWREAKATIKYLAGEQIVDRKLLRMTQEMAYAEALLADGCWEEF